MRLCPADDLGDQEEFEDQEIETVGTAVAIIQAVNLNNIKAADIKADVNLYWQINYLFY